MAEALANLKTTGHPDLLVGFNKADDAGVFRISEDTALVQTVDFFPPIVDDPYHFGQIAAANALSDIYAMGGRPVTGLNIVGFPQGKMAAWILGEILRGGTEKIEEAGAVIVGGHSVNDKEVKYGVAVTGLIHPDRVVTNSGARAGDKLYLTKPIGTGLITTGIKRGVVGKELIDLVTKQMAELNRAAAEAMLAAGVHAATDITGYGLLAHAYEMADGSGVTLRIFAGQVPLMPEATRLAAEGMIPGGANANRDFLKGRVRIADSVDKNVEHTLFDPQTSGGLLVAIPADQAQQFEKELAEREAFGRQIGEVAAQADFPIIVE